MNTFKSDIFYFWRILKNSFKVLINKSVENLFIPNFFIKNVIFINPNKIEYMQSIPMKFHNNTRLVMNFDWDKEKNTVKDEENSDYKFIISKDFYDNIKTGKDNSFIYEKKNFEKYTKLYNFKKEETIENYLKNKLNLLLSIKKNGLKKIVNNNIQFMIDRDFNLVKINSGDHRFFISKILKLENIPVEIKVMHVNCIESDKSKKSIFKKINELIKNVEKKYI